MSDLRYRPATEADLPAALDLFSDTLTDLYSRNNLPATPLVRENWEPSYRHVLRSGIFRVAETPDGRLAAICHAIVRDRYWFLSGFWVRPEMQRQKVGGPLLRQVREEGRARGAEVFSVWSTIDTTAVASYLRQGMLPGFQILIFTGEPEPASLPEPPADCTVEPLTLATALELDRAVRGIVREADHRFWMEENEPRGLARQVIRHGRPVGYYYHHFNTVGPALWTDPVHAEAVLAQAAREAVGRNPQLRLIVPGINHAALRFALSAGLRLAVVPHFLTSAPLEGLDQYLPSGPTLF